MLYAFGEAMYIITVWVFPIVVIGAALMGGLEGMKYPEISLFCRNLSRLLEEFGGRPYC